MSKISIACSSKRLMEGRWDTPVATEAIQCTKDFVSQTGEGSWRLKYLKREKSLYLACDFRKMDAPKIDSILRYMQKFSVLSFQFLRTEPNDV